jgi:hypothetical protein
VNITAPPAPRPAADTTDSHGFDLGFDFVFDLGFDAGFDFGVRPQVWSDVDVMSGM